MLSQLLMVPIARENVTSSVVAVGSDDASSNSSSNPAHAILNQILSDDCWGTYVKSNWKVSAELLAGQYSYQTEHCCSMLLLAISQP